MSPKMRNTLIASLTTITIAIGAIIVVLAEEAPIGKPDAAVVDLSVADAKPDGPPPKQYPARYSADWHTHFHGCGAAAYTAKQLHALQVEEDVNIMSALVWSYFDGWKLDKDEFKGRHDHPVSTEMHIMRVDLEISTHHDWPAAKMGHLMGLNLKTIDWAAQFREGPHSLVPIARWIREQGGTVGMAHGTTLSSYMRPGGTVAGYMPYNPPRGLIPYELPVLAALGLLDFMEVENPNANKGTLYSVLHPGPALMWKHLTNAGFLVAMVGGSDFPCMNFDAGGPGRMRTLIPSLGKAPNYESALSEVMNQRGVFSTEIVGKLELKVNGAEVPTTNIKKGEKVTFEIYTDQPVSHVEIIMDGNTETPACTCPIVDGYCKWVTPWGAGKSANFSARTKKLQTGIRQIVVDGIKQREAVSLEWLRGWVQELHDEVQKGTFGEGAKSALPDYVAALAKLQ